MQVKQKLWIEVFDSTKLTKDSKETKKKVDKRTDGILEHLNELVSSQHAHIVSS